MFAATPASPWLGGSERRNLAPPRTDGALTPAKTRHPSPFAAVVQPALKRSRVNEGSNVTIPVARVVQTAHRVELGRSAPISPTDHLGEGSICFILGKRTSKTRVMQSHAEGPRVLTGLLSSAHAAKVSQLCSLPFLKEYFHECLSGETIALDVPLGLLMQSLPASALSTSGPLGQLAEARRRAQLPGVDALGGGSPGDLSGDRLTALPDYGLKVGFVGSEAAASPVRYQGLMTRDYGVFLRGKGGEGALWPCTPGDLPLVVPTDEVPTTQPPPNHQPTTSARAHACAAF